MNDAELARHFDAERECLLAVAKRLLGSGSEAQDAVQDAWLRLARADADVIANLPGWLTPTVARICLDLLRARKTRAGERADAETDATPSPETEALHAESMSLALLVILETLRPTERVALVLHDLFDVAFEDIAEVIGCSGDAARQLASRARHHVRDAERGRNDVDLARSRQAVEAFLFACHTGDVTALLAILAPDVTLTPDRAALLMSAANSAKGSPKLAEQICGAAAVADTFAGRARAARPALVDQQMGAVWMVGPTPRAVFRFTLREGRITAIDVIADPTHIARLHVVELAPRL